MTTETAPKTTPGVPGIVDSLSAGFGIVARRPLLLLIPLLLEGALWLAPSVSLGPVAFRVAETVVTLQLPQAATPDAILSTAEQALWAAKSVGTVNILGLFAWQLPSLFSVGGAVKPLGGTVNVETLAGGVSTLLAVLFGAVFLGALYLGSLGFVAREGRFRVIEFVEAFPALLARFAGFLILLVGVYLAAGLVASLLLGVAGVGGPVLVSLASGLVLGGAVMLVVHVFFGEEAVTAGRATPVQALRDSYQLTRVGFWGTLGLAAIVFVIKFGLSIVWGALLFSPASTLAAIVGNTFIGTGTAAGIMVYYKGRSPRLRSSLDRNVSLSATNTRQFP